MRWRLTRRVAPAAAAPGPDRRIRLTTTPAPKLAWIRRYDGNSEVRWRLNRAVT